MSPPKYKLVAFICPCNCFLSGLDQKCKHCSCLGVSGKSAWQLFVLNNANIFFVSGYVCSCISDSYTFDILDCQSVPYTYVYNNHTISDLIHALHLAL